MHYSTLLYMSAKSITSITITMEANHTRNTHIHIGGSRGGLGARAPLDHFKLVLFC